MFTLTVFLDVSPRDTRLLKQRLDDQQPSADRDNS